MLRDRLGPYVKAGFSGVWVTTSEPEEAQREVNLLAHALGRESRQWDIGRGLVVGDAARPGSDNPLAPLTGLPNGGQGALVTLHNYHRFLDNAKVVQCLANALLAAKEDGNTFLVLSPALSLPPELEKTFVVIDHDLPTRDQLLGKLGDIEGDVGYEDGVGDAAVGLTLREAENAYALSLVKHGKVTVEEVLELKTQAVKKKGFLELYRGKESFSSLGGLGGAKDFCARLLRKGNPVAPRGILLVGVPGCLSGDTKLIYLRGGRVAGREITLKDLYHKFNGIPTWSRPWEELGLPTFLHSMSHDGVVFYNRVVSVVQSGVKPLLKIDFDDGKTLRATPEHRVATPTSGFVEAGSLSPGDRVLARGPMRPSRVGRSPKPKRVIINLKHHRYGAAKYVSCNGKVYSYKRVARSRLVVEAGLNGISYGKYVKALNSDPEILSGFHFLPPEMEVHHMDEDTLNDSPKNLMVLSKEEHSRLHGRRENFHVQFLKEARVTKVGRDGEEMTFDVEMEYPANNFCANGIVVHNSGKSAFIKALGNEVDRPTLLMDVGRLHSKYVGESEANLRGALRLADSLAPCVLFIDEVEKALSGVGSDGDSGVSARVFGSLLTWMNDRESDVFVALSANDVTRLPPEFSRAERLDRVFMVDLPTGDELDRIWEIYRGLYGVPDLHLPPNDSQWTGAEVKSCCRLSRALGVSLTEASKGLVPVAASSADKIHALREWAKGKVTDASTGEIYMGPDAKVKAQGKRRVWAKGAG